MTLFEGIIAGCACAVAFVKLYDWIEYQLDLKQIREANDDAA